MVLYHIEAQAKTMAIEERRAYRQHHAVPALNTLKAWLDELRPKILGNSGTANAIDYTLRRWPALIRYADDGRYPSTRFIVYCGSGHRSAEIATLLTAAGEGVLHLDEDRAGDWLALCEHLRLAPPSARYPSAPNRGHRTLRRTAMSRSAAATGKRLRHDVSPWVAPPQRNWGGIDVGPIELPAPSAIARTRFEDDFVALNPSRWMLRDDTFPGNLALFRPANVNTGPAGGVELRVAQASLGVRNLSAAAVSSRDRFLYGRFEATLQATDVPGLVTGFFLHRDSPRQEIDVEITGDRPDRILANVFYNPGSDGAKFDYGYRGTPISIDLGFDASKALHTYAIEWEPDEIRWLVDGRVVHRRVLWDPTPIPHLPMTLHVNTWPTRSRELAGRLVLHALPAAAHIQRIAVDAINANAARPPSSTAPGSEHVPSVVTA